MRKGGAGVIGNRIEAVRVHTLLCLKVTLQAGYAINPARGLNR